MESRYVPGKTSRKGILLNLGKEFPIPEADWKDLARAVESGLRGDAPTWMDKGRSFIQQVQEAGQKTANIRMMWPSKPSYHLSIGQTCHTSCDPETYILSPCEALSVEPAYHTMDNFSHNLCYEFLYWVRQAVLSRISVSDVVFQFHP